MFFYWINKSEIILMIKYWERRLNMTYKHQGVLAFSKVIAWVFHNLQVKKDVPSLGNVIITILPRKWREQGERMETGNEIHGSIWTLMSCISNFAVTIQPWRPCKSKLYSTYCSTEKIFIIHNMTGDLVYKDQRTILYSLQKQSENLKMLDQPDKSVSVPCV